MRTLFITEVGSRMWGMESLASDYDYFEVYADSTRDILRGIYPSKTQPQRTYYDEEKRLIDHQYIEVGHLINLLCKGNINAIWGVTSPIVRDDTHKNVRLTLSSLAHETVSKQSYHSIKGMAESQLKDAIKRATVRDPYKSMVTSIRTALFGVNLLSTGTINFTVDCTNTTPSDAIDDLECAFNDSTLPDTVDESKYRTYLMLLRMGDLNGW